MQIIREETGGLWMINNTMGRVGESPTNQKHFSFSTGDGREARDYYQPHRSIVVLLGQSIKRARFFRLRVSRAHGSSMSLSYSRGVPLLCQQPQDPTAPTATAPTNTPVTQPIHVHYWQAQAHTDEKEQGVFLLLSRHTINGGGGTRNLNKGTGDRPTSVPELVKRTMSTDGTASTTILARVFSCREGAPKDVPFSSVS